MGVFSACLCVLINAQFPRRSECTRQYILARRQANMCVSHFSPAARDWQENLGRLLHKRCLLLQRKHQISVALCLRRERSKFSTSYTKSRQSRVRVLFHAFQAQGNPAKICCGHVTIPSSSVSYLTIGGWHVSTARGRITGNLEGCFRIADEPAAIGQCYGARPDFGLIVDITTTRPCREWAPIIARNFGTTYQASM